MLLNCGVGEDSWEPLGLQGDQTSQPYRKPTLNIHWRAEAEAEAPILWTPDAKSQLIGKDPDAGKDWRQEEKWVTEDEMVGWHHWLNGHEFEQTPGNTEGQGSLVCCSPWGRRFGYDFHNNYCEWCLLSASLTVAALTTSPHPNTTHLTAWSQWSKITMCHPSSVLLSFMNLIWFLPLLRCNGQMKL